MRIMALDLGTKRIGVAISDELKLIARPIEIIDRITDNGVLKRIMELAASNGVERIIVGLPLNMDGSEGEQCRAARDFAEKLKKVVTAGVDFYDERLSSVQATNTLIQADISRKKRKTITDKLAAQMILQAYLDAQRKS